MTPQYVIYSRKSKFTGKGESIENQIELCRQYIASHISPEAAEKALVYEDEGFSGGTLERPQFKRMMADSHKQQFAAIVVYRLDRISRNIGDFAKLIEELSDRHIDFISIREQFDTSSPMGRAMMYIASVFSQLERETIAERIRDNMRELSKTGRWLGGTAPMGYQSETVASVSVDGKTRKACKLTPFPEDIALVKLIYDKFLETGSLTAVDQFLLEKRYTTKRGNRFTRFAIRGILTNPVYMIADTAAFDYLTAGEAEVFAEREAFDGTFGVMAYNRTLQQPGKAHKERPMNEWVIAVGKHPGVIPGETWVQVQDMLEVNRSKSYRRPRSHTALLSGLLVCKACGDYMRPKLTGRTNAAGEPIYTYLCSSKERSKGTCCSMKNANGNMLDAMVIEEIKKLPEDASLLAKLLSETGSSFTDNRTVFSTQLASLQEKLAENDAGIRSLVSSLAKAAGTAAEEYILAQIEELHRDSAALKEQIDELSKLTEQNPPVEDALALLRSMIASVGACIDECTVEEKRRYLRTIIQKIEWDGENAAVYLFAGEGELDLASGEPSREDSE
ncbi:MAG: recombinase family protein [Clostridia bacterium]|nr:recombinase family protein [Clostridia bacterium]